MDLKKVENIIRIAEERNITRAADKLFLSQPALNLQLLNLEKELGVRLFQRRGNEWSITEAGKIYVETARKLIALKKDCYSRISDVAKLYNEEIAVGAAGIQGDYMMTSIYRKFHKLNPNVKLQLNMMKGLKAQELVKNGTIDLGIILMGDKQRYHLEYVFLGHVEILLAMAAGSDSARFIETDENGEEIADLKSFSDIPFVLGPKDSTERYVSELAFEDAGIEPKVHMDVEGIQYQMAMVAAGECCSLIGRHSLPDVPEGVRLIKLRTHPLMNAYAVHRKEKYLSEPMLSLIQLAKEYWASFS